MGVFIGSIVVNTNDMARAVTFWTNALRYDVRDSDPTFTVLQDPDHQWAFLALQKTDKPKSGRNRVHLDLFTDDQAGEISRLEKLGAVRLPWDYPEEHDFAVMADPDSNEFCIIQNNVKRVG